MFSLAPKGPHKDHPSIPKDAQRHPATLKGTFPQNPQGFAMDPLEPSLFDTLLLGTSEASLQRLMTCIGQVGGRYGLSFNWSKLEAMPVRMAAHFRTPDGEDIPSKDSLLYLGSSLNADGRNGSEINRRLGMARADFDTLSRVWGHASISRARKLRIFEAYILAKLAYGLVTMCLSKVEERRLDGFQCRCLRRIAKVAPSFYSRVSNATVYKMTRQRRLSQVLQQQRMIYFGKLARRGPEDAARRTVLEPNSIEISAADGPRRQGRPRKSGQEKSCVTVCK